MSNKEPADATTLLEGSMLLQKGRADVFRQRERTKLKRVVRAIVIVFLVDWYLFRRYSSGNHSPCRRCPTSGSSYCSRC